MLGWIYYGTYGFHHVVLNVTDQKKPKEETVAKGHADQKDAKGNADQKGHADQRTLVSVTDQQDAKGKKKVGPHSMIIALSPDSKTLAVASFVTDGTLSFKLLIKVKGTWQTRWMSICDTTCVQSLYVYANIT